MKIAFTCLILLVVLTKSYGYKTCAYTSYSYALRRSVTYYYSCSSNAYCCGNRNCCTYVYARWYLWFTFVTFGVIVFIFWWYYRYRYRPRNITVASASPGVVTTGNVNMARVNNPYPAYPQPGPVTIMPGGSTVHYSAYPPPPSYAFDAPPPAYTSTSVVKQNTTVMAKTSIH